MKGLLGLLLLIPLAVFIGVFSIENRMSLSLKLWPFPGHFESTASIWILSLTAIGLMTGLLIGWLSSRKWRKRARSLQDQLDRLKHEPGGHTRPDRTGAAPSRQLSLFGNRSGRT